VTDADPDLEIDRYLLSFPRHGATVTKKGTERDSEAARLKALGWSLEDICQRLNLGDDPRRASAAIKRAMATAVRFAHDEYRYLDFQGLDELEYRLWKLLDQKHILVNQGRVIHGETGEPLDDNRLVMEVMDRIMRVKEQKAKLLGYQAPTRSEIISVDSVESEIKRLEAELNRGTTQPGTDVN
jgi:hypothetical protein